MFFVASVAAVFVVAEVLAIVAASRTPEPLRWYDAVAERKIEQMDERGPVDVVMIGTSMAWQDLVPAAFVSASDQYESAYNAGLAGGVPTVMQRWTLEEVVPRLQPKMVIWGVSSLDLAPNYGDENLDRYTDALETRPGLLADLERTTSRHSHLVRNRAMFRDVTQLPDFDELVVARADAQADVGADGERLDFTINTGAELAAIQRGRLRDFVPDPVDLRAMTATINQLTAQGIEVVIVEMPVPRRFIDAHAEGAASHNLVGESLNRLAAQLDVTMLDASAQFTDDDFVDFTHLAARPANELSTWTAERLNRGENDQREPGTTAPPPTALDNNAQAGEATDCATKTVLDEYDVEVEVTVCDDDGVAESTAPGPTLEAQPTIAPTTDGRVTLPYSSSRLVDAFVAAPCDADLPRFSTSQGQEITDIQLALVNDALDLAADATAFCGTDAYPALRSSAIAVLERAAGLAREPIDTRSASETTSRTLAAVATLRSLDENRSPLSGIVRHIDELAARLELQRRSSAQDPIQVVVIGSSLALRGLAQPILDSGLSPALNVSMAGADAEEWLLVYPRLVEDMTAPTHVVIADSTHRLLEPGDFDCRRLANARRDPVGDFRAAMFPSIDGSDWDLIIGPDVASTPMLTPRVATLLERFESPGNIRGTLDNYRGIPDSEARYPGAQFCTERVQIIRDLVELLRSTGASVSFVLLPIHPEVLAAAPDVHQQAQEAISDELTRLGVPLVVASPFTDAETYDGYHANPQGRDRLTNEILPELVAIVGDG